MDDTLDATGRQDRSVTGTTAEEPGADDRFAAPPRLRALSDRAIALALTLGTLLVTVGVRLPYLVRFTPQGEDVASLLYASRFGDPSLIHWFTEGTRRYYVEYPELGLGNDFIRPVVDASVWLNSLIAPTWHSGLMLAVNFVGHAACVGLVYLVSRRIVGLGRAGAVLGSVVFAGSFSGWSVLTFLSFRGVMMVALFHAAGVAARGRRTWPPGHRRHGPGAAGAVLEGGRRRRTVHGRPARGVPGARAAARGQSLAAGEPAAPGTRRRRGGRPGRRVRRRDAHP
jgi:hypothetical protein